MAKQRQGWSLQTAESGLLSPTGPVLSPAGSAFAAQQRGEETFQWPAEPHVLVRVRLTEEPYAIDVELVRDDEQGFVPVGVSVRRLFPTSRHRRGGSYPFAEGIRPEPVSAADMRKIPFGRIIRAAITAVSSMEPFKKGEADDPERILEERHEALDRILVPRGRPKRGRSVKWYCDLLKAARRFEERGLSPAKEIARGKTGVSENLVHQWLHVARRYEREGLCGG
jgi:hypothetical protein